MCGFCGVLGPVSRAHAEDVAGMTARLAHRGPDDEGAWRTRFPMEAGEHEVAFGHRRLSILDLSPLGHQPMSTPDGALTIAFNGEIYNYRELRDELRAGGVAFRSDCDTEVLLHGFAVWGLDLLPRLNGMYAFALFDAPRRRLVLARDPIGIKPLYWRFADDVLLFGSELGALRKHRGFTPPIDRGALGRFLRHGYVPGPGTIYRDTWRLLPGDCLVWEDGRVTTRTFWRAADPPEEPPPRDAAAAADRLEALLGDAVERQMISDVPLGAFLSGGIDSSTVVALMRERARGPVRTFSIGFRERAYDESSHARAIAQHLKTEHTELVVDHGDAIDAARALPGIYDEPFADASAIPTVLLARLTRRHVTVALSGDGGDELFGGYDHYRKLARLAPWLAAPAPLRRAGRALAPRVPHFTVANVLRHLGGADDAELSYSLISTTDGAALDRATGREGGRPSALYLDAYRSAPSADPVRRASYADARVYLPDDILVKVDRASMSVALEARVPILDYRIVRFALALPRGLAWRDGVAKAPLRDVLYRRVPRALVERPKHGFGMPIHTLLASDLRRWRTDLFAPGRLREEGHLDPDGVAALLRDADARPDARARAEVLWRLVCFQRWFARTHRGDGEA